MKKILEFKIRSEKKKQNLTNKFISNLSEKDMKESMEFRKNSRYLD
jgi:hypothetical protein